MPNEFVIKNGFFSQGTSNVTGNLSVQGTVSASVGYSGSFFTGSVANMSQITGSHSGSGIGLFNLTASGISNFTNDVRAQFSAGTNVSIVNGVISAAGGGGGGSPGGTDQAVQFNSASSFGGSNLLTYDYNTNVLSGTVSRFTTVTGSTIVPTIIDFSGLTVDPTQKEGTLYYNTGSNHLSYWTEVSGVNIDLGSQVTLRCQNDSGITLNKGTVVYIASSSLPTDTPRITTASFDSDLSSATSLGLTMTSVANGERTYVLLYGILEGIDTDAFYSGQPLYLSSSGNFTGNKPQAPQHDVRIGNVIRKQSINGSIFVRVQNGYELEELHDVRIVNPQTGDLLIYNSDSQLWLHGKTLSGSYTISGNLNTLGSVSSSVGFSGSGAQLTNLTASGMSNFTNDVRAQFSAGTNITIVGGTISSTGGGGGGVDEDFVIAMSIAL